MNTRVISRSEARARARLAGDPVLERRYVCSRCTVEAISRSVNEQPLMHSCRGLTGLRVPLVRVGVRHELRIVEREDYVRDELVQLDGNERPVMAVTVTRDDGEDRVVYAPCARQEVACG